MLIGGVIHHQLDHHLQVALVSRCQKSLEIVHRPVHRVDVHVVGNIVSIVFKRGWEEGKQPQTGDPQILKIIQFLDQARKVTDAIAVAVFKCADVQLVDDCILVPERISRAARPLCHDAFRLVLKRSPEDSGRKTTIPRGGRVIFREKGRP